MAHLFDTISVAQHTGEGEWTHGRPFPTYHYDRAFESTLADICNPSFPLTEGPEVSFGEDTQPFAIVGYIKAPTMCAPPELEQIAHQAMAASTAYTVSRTLWFGTDEVADYDAHFTAPDIAAVEREATHVETVAKVLAAAYAATPFLTPLLHLGFEAAVSLGISLNNIGVPFVIGNGYPGDAIAVSAHDVLVNLTPIRSTSATQIDVNRHQIELTRFASIQFDAAKVVRAEETP